MLTLQTLKDMEPGTVFATGTTTDDSSGINMANTGKELRWVATRGGIHDWAIYIHFADQFDVERVKAEGDKVVTERNIRKLVPCDDEAFEMYRY